MIVLDFPDKIQQVRHLVKKDMRYAFEKKCMTRGVAKKLCKMKLSVSSKYFFDKV